MAYWKPTRYNLKLVTNTFGDGVNAFLTPFDIKDGEAADMLNMESGKYPQVNTRLGRTNIFSSVGTINGLGKRADSSIHIKDGTAWKYYNDTTFTLDTISTTLNSLTGNFAEFVRGNESTNIITILINRNSSNNYGYDGTTTLIPITGTPVVSYPTVSNRRLYLAHGRTLYYSSLNNPFSFSASDAGQIILDTERTITGIGTYADKVIIFTSQSMHILYGSGPDDYQIVDISRQVGCVGHRTILEHKDILYWLDYEGVYTYSGGQLNNISLPVKEYIKDFDINFINTTCAGIADDKYYLSFVKNDLLSTRIMLVYDIQKNKWYVHDSSYTAFSIINNYLYGAKSTSVESLNSSQLSDNTTAIPWRITTKGYNNNQETSLKDIWITYSPGSTNCTMNLSYTTIVGTTSSTNFKSLAQSSDFDLGTTDMYRTRIIPPTTTLSKSNSYQFKMHGTGPMTIYKLEQNVRVKPR